MLKTLEEPPPFAHLLLLTDRPQRRAADDRRRAASRCASTRRRRDELAARSLAGHRPADGAGVRAARARRRRARAARWPSATGATLRAAAERYARAALHGRRSPSAPRRGAARAAPSALGRRARAARSRRARAEELEYLPKKERKRVEREYAERAKRAYRRAHTGALDQALQLAGLWLRDVCASPTARPSSSTTPTALDALREDAEGARRAPPARGDRARRRDARELDPQPVRGARARGAELQAGARVDLIGDAGARHCVDAPRPTRAGGCLRPRPDPGRRCAWRHRLPQQARQHLPAGELPRRAAPALQVRPDPHQPGPEHRLDRADQGRRPAVGIRLHHLVQAEPDLPRRDRAGRRRRAPAPRGLAGRRRAARPRSGEEKTNFNLPAGFGWRYDARADVAHEPHDPRPVAAPARTSTSPTRSTSSRTRRPARRTSSRCARSGWTSQGSSPTRCSTRKKGTARKGTLHVPRPGAHRARADGDRPGATVGRRRTT